MSVLLGRAHTADIDLAAPDEFWLTLCTPAKGTAESGLNDVMFLGREECVALVALLAQHGVRADSAATAEVKAFCEQLESKP